MSTLPITALWAGPTPTAYPARQVITIATPGADGGDGPAGAAGPNQISDSTATAYSGGVSFISAPDGFVRQLTFGDGLELSFSFPAFNYTLSVVGFLKADGSIPMTGPLQGYIQPYTFYDSEVDNNSLYFSNDAGKLVYKDSSGTVHPLY